MAGIQGDMRTNGTGSFRFMVADVLQVNSLAGSGSTRCSHSPTAGLPQEAAGRTTSGVKPNDEVPESGSDAAVCQTPKPVEPSRQALHAISYTSCVVDSRYGILPAYPANPITCRSGVLTVHFFGPDPDAGRRSGNRDRQPSRICHDESLCWLPPARGGNLAWITPRRGHAAGDAQDSAGAL